MFCYLLRGAHNEFQDSTWFSWNHLRHSTQYASGHSGIYAGYSGRAVWGVGLGRLVAGFRIPLKAWMSVRVFLCCVVMCVALRRADRSSKEFYICLNSSRNLLYVRRPRSFKDCRATGKKNASDILGEKYEFVVFHEVFCCSQHVGKLLCAWATVTSGS
jgi:hypothetical protein